MAKTINRLSDLKIKKINKPGWYPDGLGLYLQVSPAGTKSFVYRYEINGKERRHGLGGYPAHSLEYARREAEECRNLRKQGKDPIEYKKKAKKASALEASKSKTFKDCAESYIEMHKTTWKNPKNVKLWTNSLTTYAYPVIGHLSVQDITITHVLQIVEPIWKNKTDTANKIRQRIENIIDWSTVREYREGANPARWRGHLDKVLPKINKVKEEKHYPSLPYKDLPVYFKELRQVDTITAKALAFLILTATRNIEAREAQWSEIDAKTWTIPADRMKAGKLHRVPLSKEALKILKEIEGYDPKVLFPGQKQSKPVSESTFRKALLNTHSETIHGFRTSFRTWCAEMTNYPREIAECALSHGIGNKVEEAYQRGDMLDKRRKLMEAWSDYCINGQADADILPLRAKG